jgi:hypothetical protein
MHDCKKIGGREDRDRQIHAATRVHEYTLQAVADFLGLHYSTLSMEFRGRNTQLTGRGPLFLGRRARPVSASRCMRKGSSPSGRPVRACFLNSVSESLS